MFSPPDKLFSACIQNRRCEEFGLVIESPCHFLNHQLRLVFVFALSLISYLIQWSRHVKLVLIDTLHSFSSFSPFLFNWLSWLRVRVAFLLFARWLSAHGYWCWPLRGCTWDRVGAGSNCTVGLIWNTTQFCIGYYDVPRETGCNFVPLKQSHRTLDRTHSVIWHKTDPVPWKASEWPTSRFSLIMNCLRSVWAA